MFKVVKFGEKEIELKATAATPLRFKQVFNFDLMKTLTKVKDIAEKEEAEQIDEGLDASELITKLGFIMAMQAAKEDFTKITVASYYDWLDDFEINTIPIVEIMNVYTGNEHSEVDAKKEGAEQSEN